MTVRDSVEGSEQFWTEGALGALGRIFGARPQPCDRLQVRRRTFGTEVRGTVTVEVERGQWATLDVEIKMALDDEFEPYAKSIDAKLLPAGKRVGNARELLLAWQAAKK